jgi:hypothetical protein
MAAMINNRLLLDEISTIFLSKAILQHNEIWLPPQEIWHSFQNACMTWENQWKIGHRFKHACMTLCENHWKTGYSFKHACMTLWENQWKIGHSVLNMLVWHYGKISEK